MALDYKSSLGRYRRYLQLVQRKPLWSASVWVMMSLLLLIVLVVLALRPTLVTISGLFGQINQQKELSARLDDKILKVRKAIDEMESVREDRKYLEQAVPGQPEWEVLAEDLYTAATASGMEIVSVAVEKVPLSPEEVRTGKQLIEYLTPAGLIPIQFNMIVKGDYQQTQKTLESIQKLSRLILFSNVTIDEEKDGRLNLNITGEVAYIPDRYLQ